jgi:hypothetical protein
MYINTHNNICSNVILKKLFAWLMIGFGSILATTLGVLFWKALLYWRRLVKQPYLAENAVPGDIENHQTV